MKKKILKPLVFVTLPSILLSLAAGEIGLRVWWDDKPAPPFIGFAFHAWNKRYVKLNELGFRGPIPRGEKRPGTLRVVAIGDSITFGTGIEREEERYPELLGEMISDRFGAPIEVVNLGLGGRNTIQEYAVLREVGLKFKPDVVVLQCYYDDTCTFEERKELMEKLGIPGMGHHLATKSYLFGYLRALSIREDIYRVFAEYFNGINSPDVENIPRFREALAGIVESSVNEGADVVAVVFPVLIWIGRTPYEFQDVHDLMVGELNSLGVPYVDLLPHLKGKAEMELRTSQFDAHPNEKVHALAAQELMKIVEPLIHARLGRELKDH